MFTVRSVISSPLRSPLRAALRHPTLSKGGGVNLASLFGASDTGWLAYPGIAANLFQDTSATTPVAADNDPVGRFNDKSGKGNNLTQGTGTKRPLYAANGGKPYELYDGTDDHLLSSIIPGAACTLAFSGRALAFAGAGRMLALTASRIMMRSRRSMASSSTCTARARC